MLRSCGDRKQLYPSTTFIPLTTVRSTHNERIERLWREVGEQFCRRWKAFFMRLERLHGLDRKNPMHLWLLHHLFLWAINEDCEQFVQEANKRSASSLHHKTPEVSWRLFCN